MTNFNATVLIITDTQNASLIAEKVSEIYLQGKDYHFELTESIPENTPKIIKDQLQEKLDTSPPGSTVLTVYPRDSVSIT